MPVAKLVLAPAFALAILLSGAVPASITPPTPPPALPRPSLQHQPADVVRIVIEALANNDTPFADAGIATTFAFASPANKSKTGPLSKFTQMVKNPVYAIMIDHTDHEFSEVVRLGDKAYQMVRILGVSGAEVVFAFRLGLQQDGEFAGMWMTDAVWPVASGDISTPAF
jgi:hypothetical protein